MTVTASPQSGQQGTIGDATRLKAAGGISPWWYNWVDRHRVAGIALVGVIATQLGTYFGYVFPAVGLPTVPWPLYNGALGLLGKEFNTPGRSSWARRSTTSTGSCSRSSTRSCSSR